MGKSKSKPKQITYIDSLKGNDPDVVYASAKRESGKQSGAMVRWMEREQAVNPDANEINEPAFRAIRKAKKIQKDVYDLNAEIRDAEDARDMAGFTPDPELRAKLVAERTEKVEELKAQQMGLCWRVRKIYMLVSSSVPLYAETTSKQISEEEYREFEYVPE